MSAVARAISRASRACRRASWRAWPSRACAAIASGRRCRRSGIAIGIGAMVAVVSVSASAQANLLAEIDALGTNLLTVTPGQTFTGQNEVLPAPRWR